MTKLVSLLIFFISPLSFSDSNIGINQCGVYQFKGFSKIQGQEMVLLINEGTQSQIVLKVARSQESKIAPYLDKVSLGELRLNKILNQWQGEILEIKNIDFSLPDPLNPKNHSYLKLIKNEECKK